ncbi:MAG: caspase domain-containing protein [Sodaliphilus sp.]
MKHLQHLSQLLLLVLTISFGTGSIQAQHTYVVAVGLGHYKYPKQAQNLPCSEADARAISHFFHNYNGSSVFMLLNENATRSHILKVLKQEFAKSTVNDEIIFMYSGHGFQGGLTCYDFSATEPKSYIFYNEIQEIMKAAKARRKIILANACYSGGLNLKTPNNGSTNRRTSSSSVMLYTSSRPQEVSWERSDMDNSFFVKRILEGFQGAADANKDKKVTARELFNYVNPRVISDTYNKQHPQMWGRFDDSMVVVYVK